MRDKTHRIGMTIVVVVTFLLCIGLFYLLIQKFAEDISAVLSLIIGVLIVLSYLFYNYKNLSHDISRVNALTQIWLGLIIVVGSIISILIYLIFGVEFSNVLLIMSGIVIILLFLSVRKFDIYLEKLTVGQNVISKKITSLNEQSGQKKLIATKKKSK